MSERGSTRSRTAGIPASSSPACVGRAGLGVGLLARATRSVLVHRAAHGRTRTSEAPMTGRELPLPTCQWCGAPRVAHMTKGANGFTGWYYECGTHGKSRGEKCKVKTAERTSMDVERRRLKTRRQEAAWPR